MTEPQSPMQYLGRQSEFLVLEGYRQWCFGVINGDKEVSEKTLELFVKHLGETEGKAAYDAMTQFVKTLGLCAKCPLKTSPMSCNSLCQDEVFMLGLIAGLQNDDETTITLCLDSLVCPMKCQHVIAAADVFATTLRLLDRKLLPVPADTIKAIIAENNSTPLLQ